MITGMTKSGFAYSVREDVGDDFRVMEAIADSQSADKGDNIFGSVNLMRLVLGKEGMEALKAHLAEDDGRVPPEKVTAEITEIFQAIAEKNKAAKN